MKTVTLRKFSNVSLSRWQELLIVLGASLFLALLSQISIPLPGTPVPLTLQTLGVFLIGGSLGKKRALYAVLAYLIQGSLGLPVLAGGLANPLWLLDPKAGFLLSFLPAVWLIGCIGKGSLIRRCCSLAIGQIVISSIGMFWLGGYVGLSKAFLFGIVPFLPGAGIKILAGALLLKSLDLFSKKNHGRSHL